MKSKFVLILLLVLVMPFLIYSKDVGKKLALGCDMYSVNNLFTGSFAPPAFGVRYWILSKFGMQVNFGYASESAESGADDPFDETESQLFMGLDCLYLLSQGEKVNLNAGFSLGVNMLKNISNLADTERGYSINRFTYLKARNLRQAVDLIGRYGSKARVVAGDRLAQQRHGLEMGMSAITALQGRDRKIRLHQYAVHSGLLGNQSHIG